MNMQGCHWNVCGARKWEGGVLLRVLFSVHAHLPALFVRQGHFQGTQEVMSDTFRTRDGVDPRRQAMHAQCGGTQYRNHTTARSDCDEDSAMATTSVG